MRSFVTRSETSNAIERTIYRRTTHSHWPRQAILFLYLFNFESQITVNTIVSTIVHCANLAIAFYRWISRCTIINAGDMNAPYLTIVARSNRLSALFFERSGFLYMRIDTLE